MQFTVGIFVAKALEQRLCEGFNDSDNVYVFIHIVLITMHAQILHSRDFVAPATRRGEMHMCLPALKSKCIFWVNCIIGLMA
ncbi:MAG: hypothetical protein A2Y97_10035 [Nitrospirae bacterium RBG_13_39_12]|nr:MAG: hypothetical protein A2Y97_10035 [Nitrospirae bacterium RBG_13_39_12]